MNLDREKQYFGITPISIVDNVVNATNDYTADALDAAELLLKETPGFVGKDKQIEEVRKH